MSHSTSDMKVEIDIEIFLFLPFFYRNFTSETANWANPTPLSQNHFVKQHK